MQYIVTTIVVYTIKTVADPGDGGDEGGGEARGHGRL